MSSLPRLSPVEREILLLLTTNGPMYGLAMVKASDRLKRGTVYVTLGRMEDKGWVVSRADDDPEYPGMPRRRYTVSGQGQLVLRDVQALEVFLDDLRVEGAT